MPSSTNHGTTSESDTIAPPYPFMVVGIGASAGGLKALTTLFSAIQPDSGMAYVVIVHLEQARKSKMAEILQRHSAIPVAEVTKAIRVQANHAYIIPPDQDLSMVDGTIQLSPRTGRGQHAPIDMFLRTLGDTHTTTSVGIVLSGTGSDGTSGLRRIKEMGGITIAQLPTEASYDSMPLSAITLGVDLVLAAADIPGRLIELNRANPQVRREEWTSPAGDEEAMLGEIMSRLKTHTGHDFSGYKRSTVNRRLDRRFRFNNVTTLSEYVGVLQNDDREVNALFRDLLISVSSFFRDPATFELMEREIVPALFAGKGPNDQVRVWIAGCATGEEVYSLAMLLCPHAEKSGAPRLKIFATDIDGRACAIAREGLYPSTIAADVSPELLERFFDREGDGYRVKKALRENIVFAAHNILRDPPFSNISLISCRNVLIYLEADAQQCALESFHYALQPDGYLLLGHSETVGSGDLFKTVDSTQRVYSRLGMRRSVIPRLYETESPRVLTEVPRGAVERRPRGLSPELIHRAMLESYAPPSVIVDERGEIIHLSERAGRYLRIGPGVPSRKLVDLVQLDLQTELRTALYQAWQTGVSTDRSVRLQTPAGERIMKLTVRAPTQGEGESRFALVILDESVDTPETVTSGKADTGAQARIDQLEADLRHMHDLLETTIHARDISIEELQTSNEELQSTSEEQKATSEEMETSREELQSTNEELANVNQERRATIEELKQTNADLRNLMESTAIGTLFLERDMRIRRFTPSLMKLFNLVPTDQGRLLTHITHRLEYPEFHSDVKLVTDSLETLEREAISDDGTWYSVRIQPCCAADDRLDGTVVTFYDISKLKELERQERLSKESAEAGQRRVEVLMEQMQAAVLILDAPSGNIVTANQRARDIWNNRLPVDLSVVDYNVGFTGYRPDGSPYSPGDWPMVRSLRNREVVLDEEIKFDFGDGRRIDLLVSAAPIQGADGEVNACIVTLVDITSRKMMEEELRVAREAADEGNRVKGVILTTLSHEFRTPLNGVLGYADLLLFEPGVTALQTLKLERIKAVVWHLSTMIDEILGLARLDAGGEIIMHGPVDARIIAREAAEVVEPAIAAKKLRFTLDLPADMIEIETDRVKARQILINLLGNAVKYTEAGGITISVRGDGTTVSFHVCDTGIGIEAEHTERVFERFWQVSGGFTRVAGGTGLGLAAAREFSHLLGGEVAVKSEPGKGSEFTLTLPYAMETA